MVRRKAQEWPDVAAVTKEARAQWEERHKKTVSIQERIGDSVPWWLVLIAAVFFLLSVPHTMTVFSKITPYLGYVAPFGIEFGLLYAAFRRKQHRITPYLIILEVLLFVTAVIVNGAGSFQAVIASSEDNIQKMSFSDLIAEYPSLPATAQVALLLAPIAAFIIPIGTAVAGEGLAALVMERRETGNALELQWERDRGMVIFEALRNAAIANDITPGRAQKWAESIAFYERTDTPGHLPDTSATVRNRPQPDTERTRNGHNTGQGYSKTMDARSLVFAHLEGNPEDANLSVRELADVVGVGKTTAADVRNEFKASRNGFGRTEEA